MKPDWEKILNVNNIGDLPWHKEEDLERLGTIPTVLRLPNLSDVIEAARDTFESSREIRTDWENNEEFLKRDDVRSYLRSVVLAFQTLKESASHTDIYCEWKDDYDNVCGHPAYIAVDCNGSYYQCKKVPEHRTPKERR